MEFDFDTVVSGAGISIDAPSNLPSGDQLARRAWLSLFPEPGTQALHHICADALPGNADEDSGLRLEYLLEILGGTVPLDALVEVYRVLGGAVPNFNHVAFSGLPRLSHFTLNMDTLLERAAELTAGQSTLRGRAGETSRIVHLHGRWDRPTSITTTISQYLAQLPADLGEDFRRSVQGRRVLVAGYSGRDFDVFPVLVAHPPDHLVWLVHPLGKVVPEVDAELQRLSRQSACRVELVTTETSDFLKPYVDAVRVTALVDQEISHSNVDASPAPQAQPAARQSPHDSTGGRPSGLAAALSAVPVSRRALGAARVLFELGAFDELDRLAALDPCEGTDAALLRKVLARAARRRGRNGHALRLLLQPPKSTQEARITLGNVNEVANLLTRVGAPAIGATADRVLVRGGRLVRPERARRFELQAQVRLGQHFSVQGRLDKAAATLKAVTEAPDLRDVIGLSGEVDATTWLLDVLKAQGRYEEALTLVDRMERVAPYTNLSQRAYAYWQAGSVRLLAGHVDAARESLETALPIAQRSGDSQALSWVIGTLSDSYRDSPATARAHLDAPTAEGVPLEEVSNHYLARQYIVLQLAEQARVEGDLENALRLASRAASIRPPGRARPWKRSMNYLAARMIETLTLAEIQTPTPGSQEPREVPTHPWETQAERLATKYALVGATTAQADVRVLLMKIAGRPLPAHIDPPETSLQHAWLTSAWDWRRPWHLIA